MNRSARVAIILLSLGVLPVVPTSRAALVDFIVAPNADQIVGLDVDSAGTGAGWLRLNTDTHTIVWSLVTSNLTGPPIGAHWHGPAGPGENADMQVVIDHTLNPMVGSAVLDSVQQVQLLENLWYVNVRTEAYPTGEIRGQAVRVIPEPATVALLALGALCLWRSRRARYRLRRGPSMGAS